MGRVRRKLAVAAGERRAADPPPPPVCALCARPLGAKVEWHHPVPKAEGGTATVPVHPICHRAIHAALTNAELARSGDMAAAAAHPKLASFLRWVAGKQPDFHAPTRAAKERGAGPRPAPAAD